MISAPQAMKPDAISPGFWLSCPLRLLILSVRWAQPGGITAAAMMTTAVSGAINPAHGKARGKRSGVT